MLIYEALVTVWLVSKVVLVEKLCSTTTIITTNTYTTNITIFMVHFQTQFTTEDLRALFAVYGTINECVYMWGYGFIKVSIFAVFHVRREYLREPIERRS